MCFHISIHVSVVNSVLWKSNNQVQDGNSTVPNWLEGLVQTQQRLVFHTGFLCKIG